MMKQITLCLMACLVAASARAESLVATRTIRARSVLSARDAQSVTQTFPGAATDPVEIIGLETRVTLYKGRPILTSQLSPPATIERNASVPLAYRAGSVIIVTEGRALDRGGAGDLIRVMNVASRTTLSGRIGADGSVYVTP